MVIWWKKKSASYHEMPRNIYQAAIATEVECLDLTTTASALCHCELVFELK